MPKTFAERREAVFAAQRGKSREWAEQFAARAFTRSYAQPTISQVRPVDPVLTGLSIGFRNPNFVWDQVAPPVRVVEKSGTYFVWTKDFWFRREQGALRAPESTYTRTGYELSDQTYNTRERGFEKATGQVTQSASQVSQGLVNADVEYLTNLIQLELEKQVATDLFTTGVWGTDNTLSGTDQWSDYANSDPISDVDTAQRTIRQATGIPRNRGETPQGARVVGIIGSEGWDTVKEHPLLVDKIKYTQRGNVTPEIAADVFGLDAVIPAETVENTAAEGATFVGADIWGDSMLIAVQTPTPDLMVANGAYTMVWDERGNFPWAIDNYYEDKTRSDVSRVFTHYDVEITASDYGYFLNDLSA